ncbi:MAG: preprotein translocase subunit SecE [Bacilli bacterium]|nr:preprotein translocase subunit SecE [Bacilli bacterium]
MKKDKKKDKKKKEGFLKSVRKEMKEVRWPNKKEMVKYSFAVLACIIVLSVFFTASDLIIAGVRTILEGL